MPGRKSMQQCQSGQLPERLSQRCHKPYLVKKMTHQKIDYKELSGGYEFGPSGFRLNGESLMAYLDAVEGDKSIYEKNRIVPPMAVAALAMAAMAAGMSLPPGAIHVSQEFQFLSKVSINEALTSHARVNRKVERGKLHMMTVGINVLDESKTTVLTGETGFILPPVATEQG